VVFSTNKTDNHDLIGKMVESGIKPHKPNIPLYKSAYPNDHDAQQKL
jgi:hypothetical protein